jgi:tetratricopeptide (TPR) repeat protein
VANLTDTLIANNRCQEALPWLERADRLLPRNYVIEASWGRVLECVGRKEEALARLTTAVAHYPNWKLFELIGLLYGEMDRMDAAGQALHTAIGMEPRAGSPHRSLALWHEARHDPSAAIAEYRTALALDPNDVRARVGLARLQTAATTPPSSP